jgi:SAM-dependent methyltransferase
MISTAQQLATKYPVHNATFEVVDCSRLAAHPYFQRGAYDKVFSNAALHWIFRDPATRNDVFRDAYAALRPGGTFVFECGGAGNVAEVVTALVGALRHVADMDVLKAREMIPWYFASEAWATQKLNEAGFTVDKIELEYRPTTLNEGQGVEGWVRLFAASILDFIEESKRDAVVKHAVENLEWATKREDGTEVIGYVRLRAIAQKPEA